VISKKIPGDKREKKPQGKRESYMGVSETTAGGRICREMLLRDVHDPFEKDKIGEKKVDQGCRPQRVREVSSWVRSASVEKGERTYIFLP